MAKPGINRPLGIYESLMEDGQRLLGYMINVNYLLVGSRKELTTEDIRAALRKVQARITALRLIITGAGPNKSFKECSNFDVSYDVVDTENWRAVFDEQLRMKFAEGDLIWRVKQLRVIQPHSKTGKFYYPLIFAFNHTAVDEVSIIAGVYKYFVDCLEDVATKGGRSAVESLPFPFPREVILPQAQTTKCTTCGWVCLTSCCGPCIIGEKTNPLVDKLFRKYRPKRPVPTNGLVEFVLDVEETTTMIQACKRHGIRINGFLTGVAAVASYKLLQDSEIIEHGKVNFDTAFIVNLRPFAVPDIPDEHVGLWQGFCDHRIKVVEAALDLNGQQFWDLCSVCYREMHKRVTGGRHFRVGRMIDSLYKNSGPKEMFEKDLDCMRKKEFFTMAFLGNITIKANNKEDRGATVTLENAHWGSADFMAGDSLFVHNICILNGQLHWNVSFSRLMVTRTLAQEYADFINGIIITASSR